MTTTTTTKTISNLKKFYSRMTTAVSLTLLTATIASPAFPREPSSYQYSCRDFSRSQVSFLLLVEKEMVENKELLLY